MQSVRHTQASLRQLLRQALGNRRAYAFNNGRLLTSLQRQRELPQILECLRKNITICAVNHQRGRREY